MPSGLNSKGEGSSSIPNCGDGSFSGLNRGDGSAARNRGDDGSAERSLVDSEALSSSLSSARNRLFVVTGKCGCLNTDVLGKSCNLFRCAKNLIK